MRLRDNAVLDRIEVRPKPDVWGGNSELLERAELLLPEDRRVVELVFKNQISQRQLSLLMNIPAGTVCRRVRKIINRLCDPLVLSPEHRQLAIEHWLQGRTRSELAEEHQLSLTEVHRMLEFVRGWHRAIVAR